MSSSPHTLPAHSVSMEDFDSFVAQIRQDFPILNRQINGKPLVYLDSAASSQKPQVVLDVLQGIYAEDYSNIHRGVHTLSQVATDRFEAVRDKTQRFINAADRSQIIFTKGTTEAINLVASTYGRANIGEGDEIIVSTLEHHSNIVPWQMLCEEKGAILRVIPIDDTGQIIIRAYLDLLNERTKLVAVTQVSNALGTITPVHKIIQFAHERGVPVLLDGAQSVSHRKMDVQELDVDFYAFSAHKLYGPSGVGVLYGKKELLEAMPPYQGGGDMIASVTFEKTTYNELPYKFEAGTPNIAGVVGFGAALDYVNSIGLDKIAEYEGVLQAYATKQLLSIPGLRMIGTGICKTGVLSFVLDKVHPHDIGTILDSEGIAIRTGHHCAQPVMDRFGVPATARASLGIYNTREEIDILVAGLHKVLKIMT